MPTTVEISLEVADPDSVLLQGIHAHACRWLDTHDSHHNTAKPFALTPLTHGFGERRTFHLNLLDDSLLERLRRTLDRERGDIIRFGETRAALSTQSHRIIRHLDYASLIDIGVSSGHTIWDVDALTPILMRSGDRDLVFPLPGSVLRSLHRQWTHWSTCTVGVPDTFSGLPLLHLLEFDGASTPVDIGWRTRHGFLGAVRYGIDSSALEPQRSAVSTLMEFATFAGVGSMTTFGLGVVHVAGGRHM